jgi:AraC family transcriptional regulator
MSQPPISASQFPDFLRAQPELSAAWSAFSLQVLSPPPIHSITMTLADHVLSMQIAGTPRLRREVSGRSAEGWSGPGTMMLTPAQITATWGASEAARIIVLHIPDAYLSRVLAEDWEVEPRNVEIVGQFLARDPVVEGVVTGLVREARHGSPFGQLYAESASEFLAHHIIHSYSSLSARPPRFSGGLARHLKVVLDYIEENLGQPISLHRLAALAGVSVRHFERAFRQAVGVPPHAYVLRKRVAAARHLLLSQPTLAIKEIARRVGFSSSSHLASAFRRQTGYSPTAFRRGCGRDGWWGAETGKSEK